MLHLYISEMSIADHHGGGITLQRVLGPFLNRIQHFIHLTEFAKTLPPTQACLPRSKFFVCPFETARSRALIGCTASARLLQRKCVQLWHARSAAKRISKLTPDGQISALVCPQGLQSLRTVEALARLRNLRYITWMMDDHVLRYRNGQWQYPAGVEQEMQRHLQGASRVFVISPALGEFYREKFGIRSETLFGPADASNEPLHDAPAGEGPLRIGYFGRVWTWNLDAITHLAQAMAETTRDELHVYAPSEAPLEKLRSLRNVKLKPAIPSDCVMQRMRDYDAVLIPMSFGDELRHLTEFNIATKMSECIASGTITVVYGPPHSAMVRFLSGTDAALIIQEESISNWNAIADTIKNPDSRRRILQAAVTLAREQLATGVMQSRWRKAISQLTDNSVTGGKFNGLD